MGTSVYNAPETAPSTPRRRRRRPGPSSIAAVASAREAALIPPVSARATARSRVRTPSRRRGAR
eukprot:4217-Pelagococcus_subviridis.AAC.1